MEDTNPGKEATTIPKHLGLFPGLPDWKQNMHPGSIG